MEETIINNNNMEEKLILNSIEDAEIISVRLSPDKTPIAYENKVRCLMLSGLSREEAEKVALEPMEWLPCPRCGLRPLVWEFDNGRFTACGCGTDCYSHWSVQAESIMSVIKRSDNGKSAEAYDIDELKNNWNHWVRTGEILFTPRDGRW